MDRAALELTSTRLALLVAGLTGLILCWIPLLGVHGVESALALGIVLPPFVAAASTRLVIARRRAGVATSAGQLFGRGLLSALVVFAVPVLILALNAMRVRQCAPLEGLAFIALGPGLAVAVTSVAGTALGAWIPSPRLATFLAVLCPLVAIALGVHLFYASPAIFVFSHFVGWFPGTLYDEGVTIPGTYLAFRATTVALAGGLIALTAAALDPGTLRARAARWRGAPALAVTGGLLLAAVAIAEGFGADWGHHTTSEVIADRLGATRMGERCTVHAPRELPRDDLERLVRDCDFRVMQMERTLGVRQRRPVVAFFFRSAEEKRAFMGASQTFIAKPWRDEVYLQLAGWPHPVLAHEIAHVVAGNTARGPFRVGGQLGGWLPDPALIEGLAVAMAWDERDGLTPHQWARAMMDLELMPRLDEVLGLSFLGHPPRNAYTVAGSLVRYVLVEHGTAAVRRAYQTGDIAQAVGLPLDELERRWRAFLATVPLPDEALALARVAFERRSIFSAVCPHRLAQLRQELGADLLARDDPQATQTCREILSIDSHDAVTRALYVGALGRRGEVDQAADELALLAEAPAPVRVTARLALADASWQRGDRRAAMNTYRQLLEEPQSDDAARQIEVRVLGLEAGGREAEVLFDMLLGEGTRGSATPPVVVELARDLEALRADGLGSYLVGRQMFQAGRFDLALDQLRRARRGGLPTRRLAQEARRLTAAAAFAEGSLAESASLFREILRDAEARDGQRVEALDWLARIRAQRPNGDR